MNKLKLSQTLLPALLIVLGLFSFSLLRPQLVSAADATILEDGKVVEIDSTRYTLAGTDTRSGSQLFGFYFYLPEGFQCGDTIVIDNPQSSTTVATRDTQSSSGQNSPVIGDCVTVSNSQVVYDRPAYEAYAAQDAVVLRGEVFKYAGVDDRDESSIKGLAIYLPENFQCGDTIILDNSDTEARITARPTLPQSGWDSPVIGDCITGGIDNGALYDAVPITQATCTTYGGSYSSSSCTFNATAGAPPTNAAGGGTATDPEDENNSCEENGGVLGFIMCAAVEGFDALLGLIDRIIIGQLTIDQNRYNNDEMRTAAGVIRNISYIILVPILLVMVIGTALNFNFLDAYTIKRAMPRMLVAIIFITLSWPLLTLLVEATEVVAAGLNGIITSPFREGPGDLSLQEIFGPSLLTSVASAAVAGVGLIILLVLFGGTLAGMAALGFVILLARQIFIVALMLIAPLAILAWIFPGNDKPWNAWWSAFSKLLIMYPLIVGLLAMGRVFAKVIHPSADSDIGSVGSEEIIEPIAAFIVYFLPYAFIPFAFKTAGGIFGQVTGAINDRGKGFFDKQREKRGDRLKRMQNQGMLNEDRKTAFGRVGTKTFNKVAGVATNNPLDTTALYSKGKIWGLKNRAGSVGSKISGAEFQDTQEMAKGLQENGISVDQAYRILSGTHDDIYELDENGEYVLDDNGKKIVKHKLKGFKIKDQKDLQFVINALSDSNKANDHVAASQLSQAAQFVIEGHKNEKYGRGSIEGAALLGLSSQGFADNEDIVQVANKIGGTTGSLVANQASYLNYSKGRLDSKPTYGVQYDNASGKWTFEEDDPRIIEQQKNLVLSTKQHEFVQLKGDKPVKKLKKGFKKAISDANASGDTSLAQSMMQNIATSALSSTDAKAKAEWRKMFAEIKGIDDPGNPVVDLELRRTMYGDIDPNTPEGRQMREMIQRQQEISGDDDH